jgi:hypothetical protein
MKKLLILGLLAAVAPVVWACHPVATQTADANGSAANVPAMPADNQPNIDAQFPATASANRQIALLEEHGGDRFPLVSMNGEGGYEWTSAEEVEAQAVAFEERSRLADGTVSQDATTQGFINRWREQAAAGRLVARRTATVEAIIYAIRKEPGAWRLDGNYLRSSEAWIRIGDGPKCVWLGHILAGETLGCGNPSDNKDALWTIVTNARKAGEVNAATAFAPAAQPASEFHGAPTTVTRQSAASPPRYAPEPVDAGTPPDPPQSGPFRDTTGQAPQSGDPR